LTYFFPKYVRLALTATLALLAEILLTLEVAVHLATGGFVTAKTMWVVTTWVLNRHDDSIIWLPLMEEVGLVAWVVATGLFAAIAFALMRQPRRWANYACLSIFGIGAVASALASVPRSPKLAWSPPLLDIAVHAALVDTDADDTNMLARSVPELHQLYQKASHLPVSSSSAFFGKAQDYNVLLFVLEAIPAQVFDPARDSLEDMPNVRRLRQHAFVSAKHYTTFPATNYAALSLFTSLYIKGAVGSAIGNRPAELPGMVRSLRTAGYKTAFYGYVWKVESERDDRMLLSLGFEKIVEPTINESLDRGGWTTFVGPISYVENNDLQVLHSLRDDIHRWTAGRQKFAAAFFPEIGHDPWRELAGQKSISVKQRGHALAVYQDAWLGELIDELERDGALERTIIVITSDHGLRWLPAPHQHVQFVSPGRLDDIVVHVPLLVYVPEVLSHPVTLEWPTSHIDIAPTILDLLGVPAGRELEEGTAIWNPGITKRRLFLSMDPFGADGFFDSGNYYMRNASRTTLKSDSLHFEDRNTLAFESEESVAVRQALAEQNGLQRALSLHLLDGHFRPR
jgi:arylsulfatase A-like enzyme